MRSLITKLMVFVWFVICSPFLAVSVVTVGTTRFMMHFICAGVICILRIFGGIKIKIEGDVPTSGIVASKHMSAIEVPVLFNLMPNSFFVLKRELMWIPIYGWAFWRSGMLPVNRAKGATDMRKLADKAGREMASGRIMVIFPEGTRVKVGDGSKFKRGLLFIAEHTKAEITPVGLNTGLFWGKGGAVKPGVAVFKIGSALPADSSLEVVREEIQKRSV